MMADLTSLRQSWQGLMIEDPRVSVSVTSGDEDGTHVGPAIPGATNTGSLQLRALRTERDDATAVDDLTIACQRPGAASTAGRPAALTATIGAGSEMGWMWPSSPFQFRYVGATTFGARRVCRRGGSWSTWVNTGDLSSYSAPDAHDICAGSDPGTVLHVEVTSATLGTVIRSHLYADGATSSPQSTALLTTDMGSDTIKRLRVCAHPDGTALLLIAVRAAAGATRDRIHQWSSDDGGLSWDYVGRSDDGATDYPMTVGAVVAGRVGYVVTLAVNSGAYVDNLVAARVASPRLPVWSASWSLISIPLTPTWDSGTAALADSLQVAADTDETGRIWLAGIRYGSARTGVMLRSDDDGVSWTQDDSTHTLYGYWYAANAASDRPSDLSVAAATGSLIVGYEYGSGHYQLRVGGWSSRVMPVLTLSSVLFGLACGISASYLATNDAPADYGWTAGGTSTATSAAGSLSITGTGGARTARTYTATWTGSTGTRVFVLRWTSKTAADRTSEKSPIYVDVAASDNVAHGWSVRIALGHNEIALYKRTGSTTYTSITSTSVTNLDGDWVDWIARVEINADTGAYAAHVSGRRHGASITLAPTDHLDNWVTKINTSGTLTDIFGQEPADRVEWGSWVTSTETAYWSQVAAFRGSDMLAATTAIVGRDAAPRVWMPPDVLVEIGGGLAADGDTWTVSTEADGSVQHVLDPDVGLVWRSPGTGAATLTVSWPSGQAGQMFGVLLRGLVAEGVTVKGDGSLNLGLTRAQGPLTATKDGTILRPTGTGVELMLREGEGSVSPIWMKVSDGVDSAMGRVAQIRAGHWGPSYSARVVLDSIDAAVADGAVNATFYPSDLLLIVHKTTDDYTSITIELAAASATWPTGTQWQVQRVMVGPVLIMGDGWSWSTTLTTDVASDDGKTSDGRLHPRAVRPAYRTLTVNWQEGVDESQAPADGTGNVVGDGFDATAWVGATLHTIEGLLCELSGPQREVVAILDCPTGAIAEDGSATLYRRHDWIHGRITSSVARDGVISSTGGDLARGGDLTIEEIT